MLMKMIRTGEYDLVNISLIGHDHTGRSYAECRAEFNAALLDLEKRVERVRWWQILERCHIRWQLTVLTARLGM
jgi:hypothetical protein